VKKLSGFDMNLLVYDPYLDAPTIQEAGAKKVELETLLEQSRFILLACPLTKETEGLIGENELRKMRSDAILINCARGPVVREKALIEALKQGWIKAAALDVLEVSPPGPTSELLSLENVTLTPHLGGASDEYPDSVFRSSVEVIIEMSKMHLPRWIANQGVKPKWNMNSGGKGV